MHCMGDADDCDEKYVASLDVGTTTIRCYIYNSLTHTIGSSQEKIELLQNEEGCVEMDEEHVFSQAVQVIQNALIDANLPSSRITCLGITTQRNTFITWDKETGLPFHHLITWQDLRASKYVDQWNSCMKMKCLNGFFKCLHLFTRNKRFLAGSILKFRTAQVILRLKWMIENNSRLKERIADEKVMFGTLDTWLLWKLTGQKIFATDYSNASSTAMFDPFQMSWSNVVCNIVGIPLHILPPILDTSGHFGCCDLELFGSNIPITAVVADQQSSMFGQCCFHVGDIKCTLGTGSFIDCNTADRPHTSTTGFYPLVGWKIGSECVYLAEGFASNTGQSLEWAKSVGFMSSIEESEEMALKSLASSATSSLCFVQAFNGFQAPINDDTATSLLIGMTLKTTKEDIVRSVLNSIAFRFNLLYLSLISEIGSHNNLSSIIMCDGGVSNNNYLMEVMCQLINKKIARPKNVNATSLGAAFLAGLASGMWQNKEELVILRKNCDEFSPLVICDCSTASGHASCKSHQNSVNAQEISNCQMEKAGSVPPIAHSDLAAEFQKWLEAVNRCKNWQTLQ